MKTLCNFCSSQTSNGKGSVECGKSVFVRDEYGNHKQGAACIHDSDLKDFFMTRTGHEISIHNLSSTIERQSNDLMKARDKITALENRLVKVGDV